MALWNRTKTFNNVTLTYTQVVTKKVVASVVSDDKADAYAGLEAWVRGDAPPHTVSNVVTTTLSTDNPTNFHAVE